MMSCQSADTHSPANIGAHVAFAAPSSTKAGGRGRDAGIDALRASVTLLVIFFHAAITYGSVGSWYYKEIAPSSFLTRFLLTLFCATDQAWFMGLFFLLAGYYTPGTYRHYGARGFVRVRLIRLGIPLVVYSVLLHPMTVALAETANGRSFFPAFNYLLIHRKFEPGPLWFVEALLIFTAAWLLWRLADKRSGRKSRRPFPSSTTFLITALLTGTAAFFLRVFSPVGVNVLFLQLGYFASYVVLFVVGCVAAQHGWLEQIPEAQKRGWLRVAWATFPILPALALLAPGGLLPVGAEGGWNLQALVYAFWEPFVAWGFILGLLSFFQRHFTVLSGAWQSLARRAFLIYILHPPILVGVALIWQHNAAPALVKFVVTGSTACILCYLAAGLLLRVPSVARIV
jgi:peptidoglycan/LPS O-acetylase OafA/YrhL